MSTCKICNNKITSKSDIKHNRTHCAFCRAKTRNCSLCFKEHKSTSLVCTSCKYLSRALLKRICNECSKEFVSKHTANTCNICWSHKPNIRYSKAKIVAKDRKIIWSLSLEEYSLLITNPCYYCDGIFGTVLTSVGLDRLDNTKGYEANNVVSCCGPCNRTRGDFWTPEETKHIIKAGIEFRKFNKTFE